MCLGRGGKPREVPRGQTGMQDRMQDSRDGALWGLCRRDGQSWGRGGLGVLG